MAGMKGNVAWWAYAKQSAKGAVPTVATDWVTFTGGNIRPDRETANLQETDSSRDQGKSYIKVAGASGTPETYVRDDITHHLFEAALGTRATTGTTPNYTHTLTPASSLPYFAYWRMLSDTLWERFDDCMVDELTIKADAGSPLTVAAKIMGRSATRLTTDPSAASAWTPLTGVSATAVYNYSDAVVTVGGGVTALVDNFELSIANGVGAQQTNSVVPYDLTPGTRIVNLSFDLIFETIAEYAKFHYGSAVGTAQAATIYTTPANFTFTKGANNSINLDIPVLAYEEFDPEPNAGGDAVKVSVRAQAQRPNPVITAVVKNNVAT